METEVIQLERPGGAVGPPQEASNRPGSVSESAASKHDAYRNAIAGAVRVLEDGGLLSFPTETVYAVAARADSTDAVARLRTLKSRESGQAFTVHVGLPEHADRFAPAMPGLARRFIRKAWPGPLTLILPVDDPLAASAMKGLPQAAADALFRDNTVGLRCPDDVIARAVLTGTHAPVIAASANRAGLTAATTAEDALSGLSGQIDLLLDGGATRYGKPSTIVRVSESSYDVLREGVLDAGIVERLAILRVLLVCTGNTCRSPMAEALAKILLAERLGIDVAGLPARGIQVSSAGIVGGFGGVSLQAVETMARRGYDLSAHASTLLTTDMVAQADHVYTMTRRHLDDVLRTTPSAAPRVELLLDGNDIDDPIGGTVDEYDECARLVEQGLRKRLQEVNV